MKAWRWLVPWFALCVPSPAAPANLNTADIVAGTARAALSCMQWRPVGVCFWLDCSPVECDVRTSVKVGHFNPDLVVSVYNELGGNPWREVRSVLGHVQRAAARGVLGQLTPAPPGSSGNRTGGGSTRLVFREADVVGHPLADLLNAVPVAGLICASQTGSGVPYFQSALDALAWRRALPESLYPASFVPGLREVGGGAWQSWGSVYPRNGWIVQPEEPKAAAVIAQRAADIVTRAGQPHVYVPLSGPDPLDQRVWPPGGLVEGDGATGRWQMLAPLAERDCAVFGHDDRADSAGWGAGRVDVGGDYVWNLWRPYRCCARRGFLFLFDIDWRDYP